MTDAPSNATPPPRSDDTTGAAAVVIKPIARDVIHRICSGQVILDLSSCVKELIENALDAGATNIEVRLKDHGTDTLEVSDNGGGVGKSSYGALTQKYATSKLSKFEDLEDVRTFGFRGEALSSMCGISGEFSVTTRTEEDASGTRIVYDWRGDIAEESVVPRSVGTTATVKNLFEPLPVRRKEFLRNAKREYGKALSIIQAYALMSKGVRILCTHQSGKYGRSNVLHTRGGEDASVRENIVTVFGSKMIASMREVELELGGTTGCKVVGFISKAQSGCGRAGSDRQFYFVNGRPVDLPKVAKVVNETYRSFNPSQAPMVVFDLQLPTDAYDVNVTPDKRKVMLHVEQDLLARLKEALLQMFEPSRYTFSVTPAAEPRRANGGSQGEVEEEIDSEAEMDVEPTPSGREVTFESLLTKAKSPDEIAERRGTKREAATPTQRSLQNFGFTRETTGVAIGGGWEIATRDESVPEDDLEPRTMTDDEDDDVDDATKRVKMELTSPEPPSQTLVDQNAPSQGALEMEPMDDEVQADEEVEEDEAMEDVAPTRPDVDISDQRSDGKLAFSMDSMLARRRRRAENMRASSSSAQPMTFEASKLPDENGEREEDAEQRVARASSELERVFNKSDFAKMHIVGQFNLGFILATLGDDLFIIDQHASDEIYNFEKLQRNTTMTKQPLLKPVPLDLSAAEEQTVLRNMPVFLKNGFGFCDVAENVPGADINNSSVDPGSMCGAASSVLKLNAVPFLKNVAFDKSDVQELVSLLDQGQHSLPSNSQLSIGLRSNPSDAEPERVLRPGKVRAALAMRACRSSIMIGTALDARTMRRVLRNLSTLSAPWNCPHGRPTMRHVRRLR